MSFKGSPFVSLQPPHLPNFANSNHAMLFNKCNRLIIQLKSRYALIAAGVLPETSLLLGQKTSAKDKCLPKSLTATRYAGGVEGWIYAHDLNKREIGSKVLIGQGAQIDASTSQGKKLA